MCGVYDMAPDDVLIYVFQILTALLLVWSEYLGSTARHKSNSILDLIKCWAGGHTDPNQAPPPYVAAAPVVMASVSSGAP